MEILYIQRVSTFLIFFSSSLFIVIMTKKEKYTKIHDKPFPVSHEEYIFSDVYCISFHVLLDNFYGRCRTVLLSTAPLPPKKTQIAWPAHSPDYESFEFLFLGLNSKRSTYSAKPTTVGELITEENCESVLHNVALNVLKRANLCVQQNRDHFQHIL